MENFYSVEQKIVELKFSMKINSIDSLELAKLILKFTQDHSNMFDSNNTSHYMCSFYSLMSVLKKITDKKDKKKFTLKLNGSEYHALNGILGHYHTTLLGNVEEAYTWALSYQLLEQMA